MTLDEIKQYKLETEIERLRRAYDSRGGEMDSMRMVLAETQQWNEERCAEIERLRNALQRIAAFEADPYRQEAGDDADACARIAAHALQWRGVTDKS